MPEATAVRRFLLVLRSNWISWSGAIFTTVTFLSMVTFYVLLSVGFLQGPYLGTVAFLVLPGLFVLGLAIVPLGLLVYRRKLRERMDLITHRPLKLVRAVGILTLVNVVAIATAGYQGVHYMDSVEFCGVLCHEVMEPQYTAYLDSPHARVPCVDCHIGPGASWFAKSKLSGVRQVLAVMFDTYRKPTPVPVEDLRPARETCEQCHWPDRFQGDKLVVRQHYEVDRDNTPYANVLVLKTGGTRPDGTPTGIHWHVHSGIRVTYVATDRARSEIPWVKLVDEREGTEEIFTVEGVDPARPPEGELRTMDCVDCHNQPSHLFRTARVSVDDAISEGFISRRLPFVKKVGLAALSADWTRDGAAQGIRQSLSSFYEKEEPIPAEMAPLVDQAAETLASIWKRNVFPDMKIRWDTYPSFAGHFGCDRCHDDKHRNGSGEPIPVDCDTCHVVLSFREREPTILDQLGLER